jgi:hypothetical protein
MEIDKINEFTRIVRKFINSRTSHIPFKYGCVKRLNLNGKFIYLWQNAKGDVHYSFSIFEKEYYTTSVVKLGNVLTQHFGVDIEVVNNKKEQLKKVISATTGLNKALSDSDRYEYYSNFSQEEQAPVLSYHSNRNQNQLQQYNNKDHLYNQEKLYSNLIELSIYYLDKHIETRYIKLDDLPIIHKERFEPKSNKAFFSDENGLNIKNKFISTPYNVYEYNYCEPKQSFILVFILFMVKNDIWQALKILAWITEIYRLYKLPVALVLHSQNDEYMKLFFEELIEPLFNSFQCEKIENNQLEAKELASNLDEKFIYNFHNISAPSILGEASYELTNKLLNKDSIKVNKKSVTTVSNIVITSTSKYIPMINADVLYSIVEIDSNIDELCKYLDEKPNKYTIAKYIQKDIPNFVSIIREFDPKALNTRYNVVDLSISDNLLDGDTDATKVFDIIIRDKDVTPFKSIVKTKTDEKIVDEIEDNFSQNRVDKAQLLKYFELLFGKGMYKSNRALISALGKDYSKTAEPFDNLKTHVRSGRAYYFLNN